MPETAVPGTGRSGLLLTLTRGIRVLESIASERGRASAKSLSAELGLSLGTCYQLLRTLQANGYVQRLQGGRYGLGSRLSVLADHYESALRPDQEVLNVLEELHERVQETVYVSIPKHGGLPIASVLEGTRMLRVGNLQVGSRGLTHIRASTKAYLAHLDEPELSDFCEGMSFEKRTSNTITNWDDFVAELARTRERGYSIDDQELFEGVSCIGSVIFDFEGRPCGAYTTSFPSTRFATEEQEIARHLLWAGEEASRRLGYEGPYGPRGK